MMFRSLPKSPEDGFTGSAPSAASLFAQALLGKPTRRIAGPETTTRPAREECLAGFSTRYGEERRKLQVPGAEPWHEREILEWAAGISAEAADKLRASQRTQAEEHEAWHRAEQFTESLFEGTWDPSKHPRAPKGQPIGGQWVAKGGGAGEGSVAATGTRTTTPATTASYSGRGKVDARQVSWHPPVGHHWAPRSVIFRPEIRTLLSDDAIAYAMGAYSGPTDPSHLNGNYGGVKHRRYNELVDQELMKFIKARKIEKMTAKEMEEFIGLINNGLGANGEPNKEIADFNNAIRKALPTGTSRSTKMEDVLAAGRKYMRTSRFRLLATGAMAAGLVGDMLQKHVDALEVAGKSGHYRRAMRALEQGDIAKAHALMTGDGDSLYSEILVKVGFQAATNFRIAMNKVFEIAHERASKFE
jgi:hypothetical protein